MRAARSIFLALGILSAAPAYAQTYDPSHPVCLKVYHGSFGGGEWNDCSYYSMPQCQASAAGRAAMCVINPYFAHAMAPNRKVARRVYR